MKKLIFILFLALTLRFYLSFIAYHGDLNNNISWGTLAVERGLSGFYGSANADDWPYSAPNQPPLSILMFAGLRILWKVLRSIIWYLNWELLIFPSKLVWFWDDYGMRLLVKLPSIIADLGIGLLIYKFLSKEKNEKTAFFITSVWLFNPIVWYNSAIWGQTDSIVNLLGLIGIFALIKKDLNKFVVFITLSLLFKASLLIFIPVLFFIIYLQGYSLVKLIKAVGYLLVTATLVSVWFHPHLDLVAWLINLYKDRILPGEIGYLTANAFNFWWLVDPGKTLDSTIYFGLPARFWGFLIVFSGIAIITFWLKKKVYFKRIFFSLMFVSLLSFLFLTRVHERYLYPFFPLATFLLTWERKLFLPYFMLSFTFLLNMYHLFWAPSFPFLEKMYINPEFAQILSLINIFAFFILLRHLRSSKI